MIFENKNTPSHFIKIVLQRIKILFLYNYLINQKIGK